ncbi:tyrosine-type recombinase/integrase [Streptococcus suis]|uniref:Site-specific integrase n=1 Tax=Streptococcus suis TaxID=1307 RepID=A0AAD0P745_STRSU|nr:site-specific integrase [Streptococcus suis]AWX96427.1 site-specific integrase [Streptococcus suis]AWX98427.1 site-specific integrase [Streptococcus suis]MBS8056601.1 site-specific integrase [Streptococcus suis]MCL4942187.1 site-specific integrase [Streptococcus suis]HEM2802775.1 site-specific integrase [Streptococcus suis]
MKIYEITKKNGTIVYRASVYLGVDQLTGKKIKSTITGRTKKELKIKIKQAELEFKNNGSTRFKNSAISAYQELAELWWESYKHTVKPNTQDSVRKLLDNHVLPLFGSYKLDKLTTPLIQSVINDLANKTNKGEIGAFLHYDKIHALNKRILQYGVTMQALPTNPSRDVILPRNTQKSKTSKVKYFDNQELKQFLDYLDNIDLSNYRNLYEFTLYKFLLATGCRINEALALSWSDIDFENSVVHITKTLNYLSQINSPKSKASFRDIDIDSITIALLKKYKLRQKQEAWQLGRTEEIVFSDFIHEYPNNKTLSTRLITRFKHAGVPNIGFHGFRHTHASLLLNSGIPYKELQHRLGHSTLSMTMDTYSHLSKENAKKAVSFYETALKAL